MPTNKLENEQSKKSFKLIIGIVLAILLLGGGGYLVYRFWPKKSSGQVQQEQEKKAKLQRQIKLIKEKIAKEKTAWEKKKAGRQDYDFDPFDELPEEIVFSNPDKEVRELQKEKNKVLEEHNKLQKEIREDLGLHPDQASKQEVEDESLAKALADWNRQKNNQWRLLTEKLDKDPTVKAKFDQIITTFYHRYKDSKKNSIPTHPGVNFRGFRNFYIDRQGGFVTEMGNTGPPEDYKGSVQTAPTVIIKDFPLEIKLNQLYMLNNGRNPGGAMDKFYYEKPTEKVIKYLDISFDKLRKTIAHEIAHAFQNAKNISEDKAVDTGDGIGFGTTSDCMESGEGERDEDHNLIKPVNPELVYEHKRFEVEIEAMLEKSTEFKEFERWWKATS